MQHSVSHPCCGHKAKLGIIGIGNELAGDDGAGIEVVRRLSERWRDDSRVFLYTVICGSPGSQPYPPPAFTKAFVSHPLTH